MRRASGLLFPSPKKRGTAVRRVDGLLLPSRGRMPVSPVEIGSRERYSDPVAVTRSSLLLRLRESGDEESWREFVALYEPLLLRYVRTRGLPDEDARDLVQNILASLVTSLRRFELDRTKGRFRTWLWRVTQNAIADWARRRRRERAAEKGWCERLEALQDRKASEAEAEWESGYRQRVLEFSLKRIREKTDPRTWACFEGHVLRGRSGAAVAEELEMKTGTVYVNASRVLGRVRRLCADYMEELEDEPHG